MVMVVVVLYRGLVYQCALKPAVVGGCGSGVKSKVRMSEWLCVDVIVASTTIKDQGHIRICSGGGGI